MNNGRFLTDSQSLLQQHERLERALPSRPDRLDVIEEMSRLRADLARMLDELPAVAMNEDTAVANRVVEITILFNDYEVRI
jgi:hypothetical protein